MKSAGEPNDSHCKVNPHLKYKFSFHSKYFFCLLKLACTDKSGFINVQKIDFEI